MSYSVQNIRNVCLLGHSGSGKTALTESLLYMTGAIDRMGKAADGNTVCDYDPEEIKRQISISTAVAPVEYNGCKINVLDMTLTGLRDYPEAIITKGGVNVKEIDPGTMESKLVKGLYFAGEVLDLDALTGGFNLQIAWSTGYAAGNAIQ